MVFAVPADHKVKTKENRKRDKYLDLARGQKIMDHDCDGDNNCGWCTRNNPQRIDKGTGRLGCKRTKGDHPDYNIIILRKVLETRRLAVTQTLARNHHLMLV